MDNIIIELFCCAVVIWLALITAMLVNFKVDLIKYELIISKYFERLDKKIDEVYNDDYFD